MKKINCAFIALLSFSLYSIGFAQQNQPSGKKNMDAVHKQIHSLFKKSGAAMLPQSVLVPYTFSYSTGTYADLANPVSLNNGLTWDDPQFTIPIGFNFTLWNDTITSISIDAAGLGGILLPSSTGIQPFISYMPDIVDRGSDTINWEGMSGSLSPVSYEETGTVGSRIIKVEWKNAGFYSDIDSDNVSTDFVNFQIWLYEGINNLEIRFGSSSITQPTLDYDGDPGPAIGVGVVDLNEDTLDFFCLQGNPAFPTDTLIDEKSWITLSGSPPNGIIYKFSWSNTAGITYSDIENKHIEVFPNPSNGVFNLEMYQFENLKMKSVEIYNVLGEKMYAMDDVRWMMANGNTSTINEQSLTIDISSHPSGVYFLQVRTDKETINKKIVIQK